MSLIGIDPSNSFQTIDPHFDFVSPPFFIALGSILSCPALAVLLPQLRIPFTQLYIGMVAYFLNSPLRSS